MIKNNEDYLNLWIKSGLSIPNPKNIQYVISHIDKHDKSYDIEGRDLQYIIMGVNVI